MCRLKMVLEKHKLIFNVIFLLLSVVDGLILPSSAAVNSFSRFSTIYWQNENSKVSNIWGPMQRNYIFETPYSGIMDFLDQTLGLNSHELVNYRNVASLCILYSHLYSHSFWSTFILVKCI